MHVCVCVDSVVTHRDEHAQLALSSVLCVNVELNREASRDTGGETGTTSSHFAGIVSGQDPELEGAEGTSEKFLIRKSRPTVTRWYCGSTLYLRGTSSSAYVTATEYGPSTVGV